MTAQQVIPVLRIFDFNKAIEFYIGWLGFTIDWENAFEKNSPVYLQVSKDGIRLHLSEHHGDAVPGARVFIWCTGLKDYHKILLNEQYKYNRPGLEDAFYGAWSMEVIDPFGNRLTFNEEKSEQ